MRNPYADSMETMAGALLSPLASGFSRHLCPLPLDTFLLHDLFLLRLVFGAPALLDLGHLFAMLFPLLLLLLGPPGHLVFPQRLDLLEQRDGLFLLVIQHHSSGLEVGWLLLLRQRFRLGRERK